MSRIPHRQKMMWIHRIESLTEDKPQEATPQSSESTWTAIMAANMNEVRKD